MQAIKENSLNMYKSIDFNSEKYPGALKLIKNPPKKLWYSGNLTILQKSIIGTVGPRKPTSYVQMVLEKYLHTAMSYDHITISGGASGVDKLVHTASIDAGIPTVVILGMGIEKGLQSSRRGLFKSILAGGGLLLSEFPPTYAARNRTYPQRNRIISALSTLLYIPGGTRKSGTEHTLKAAIEQNKPLYGTMGSIFDAGSELTNFYIAQGVMQGVIDFSSLFSLYKIQPFQWGVESDNGSQKQYSFSKKQERLLGLCKSLQSLEELVNMSGYSVEEVMVEVGRLELAGLIKQTIPGKYLTVM